MKRFFIRIALPWSITVVALWLAFQDVEWSKFKEHAWSANLPDIGVAVFLTIVSYFVRAIRWPLLFPSTKVRFSTSYRLLVLGFFMNNILPARAGEFVRAHLGGKATGAPRTLVLATVASERLADGLTISLMFAGIIVFLGRGHLSAEDAQNLTYVAYLFVFAALGVIAVLLLRGHLFALANKAVTKLNHRTTTFAVGKLQTFIEGLSPLCSPSRAVRVALWSIVVWSIELCVFASVGRAFGSPLPLSAAVLFMVAVNFSSLVPAAPGGFGTIELFAKKVLLSVGVAGDALALAMVITQHLIQYSVIGVQGIFMLVTGRCHLQDVTAVSEESPDEALEGERSNPA